MLSDFLFYKALLPASDGGSGKISRLTATKPEGGWETLPQSDFLTQNAGEGFVQFYKIFDETPTVDELQNAEVSLGYDHRTFHTLSLAEYIPAAGQITGVEEDMGMIAGIHQGNTVFVVIPEKTAEEIGAEPGIFMILQTLYHQELDDINSYSAGFYESVTITMGGSVECKTEE